MNLDSEIQYFTELAYIDKARLLNLFLHELAGSARAAYGPTAEQVHDEIDCRECAECCRVTEVQLAKRDVEKLAKFLRLREKDFLDQYTMTGEDGELILKRTKEAGCVFLAGNECTVYEARPGNCERFPHVLKGAGSIPSRMWQFVDRAEFCPIVYNWIEKVKEDIGF